MSSATLGPLEERRDGEPAEIARRRLRTLLGLLLLDPGGLMPVDRLIAGIWDGRAPSAVGNALRPPVSRPRPALGKNRVRHLLAVDPARAGGPVRTTAARLTRPHFSRKVISDEPSTPLTFSAADSPEGASTPQWDLGGGGDDPPARLTSFGAARRTCATPPAGLLALEQATERRAAHRRRCDRLRHRGGGTA